MRSKGSVSTERIFHLIETQANASGLIISNEDYRTAIGFLNAISATLLGWNNRDEIPPERQAEILLMASQSKRWPSALSAVTASILDELRKEFSANESH